MRTYSQRVQLSSSPVAVLEREEQDAPCIRSNIIYLALQYLEGVPKNKFALLFAAAYAVMEIRGLMFANRDFSYLWRQIRRYHGNHLSSEP